jgi:hypothetical protein
MTVYSAEDGAGLATDVASVRDDRIVEPIQSTDKVRLPTEGEGAVVETVGALTLEATQASEEIAQEQADIEQETILVSQPLSPTSTAATAAATGGVKAETQVRSTREDSNKILMMLEKTMEKVCEWSERIEAQSSATAEHDVQV